MERASTGNVLRSYPVLVSSIKEVGVVGDRRTPNREGANLLARPSRPQPDHGIGRGGHFLRHGVGGGPGRVAVEPGCGREQSEGTPTYRAHHGAAMTQYVLVVGLAAIALAVVVNALGQAARRRGARRLGAAAVVAGLTAAAVSLIECVLGLLLADSVAPHGETERAGRLFDLINRLDGVKM